MSTQLKLTKTRLIEGVWEGLLDRPPEATGVPQVKASYLGTDIDGIDTTRDEETGKWVLRVPIPAEAISDGLQTFVITDATTGEVLSSFAIHAGDPLAEDIRTEIGLLRAELDMLKKAFRRHCVETGTASS